MVTVKVLSINVSKRSSIKYLFMREPLKLLKRNKWTLFYLRRSLSRLNLKSNYMKHLNNCDQPVSWRWYWKFFHAWRIISLSTSKTKLSENYFFVNIWLLSVTCGMLNLLVKPNGIKEREPWDILLFLNSQRNVSKITLKLQPHRIIWCFCKTVVRPEDFLSLAKCSCNFKLEILKSILIIVSATGRGRDIKIPLSLLAHERKV